ILAALVRRGNTQKGGLVEVSLLESTLDFQFEVLTTHFNDGGKLPCRAKEGSAHAYLGAPYGVYTTKDNYISIAMVPLPILASFLNVELPDKYQSEENWFEYRDEIKAILQKVLLTKSTAEWLEILEAGDVWCSAVFDYKEFLEHDGYKILKMDQEIITSKGEKIRTTCCPIRVDNKRYYSYKSAPLVGEDTNKIIKEFNL
ncbi:CoA transferase, partial [Arenibacter certesii]